MKVIDYYKGEWKDEFSRIPIETSSEILDALSNLHWQKKFSHSEKEVLDKIDRNYLYWSKAKQYASKFGLTESQFWAVIKQFRSGRNRIHFPIIYPYEGTLGESDFKVLDPEYQDLLNYSIDPAIQEKLYRIDRLIMEALNDKEPDIADLLKSYYFEGIVEEAIATSKFEGANTRREVAKEMLYTHRLPKDGHEQMIYNAYRVTTMLMNESNLPDMDLAEFISIHNKLIEKTNTDLQDDDFMIRNGSVEIQGKNGEALFRPVSDQASLIISLASLLEWINGKVPEFGRFLHPIIKAIISHYWVAYIHPFYDGNGRTARLMFYWHISRFPQYQLLKYVPISTTISKRRKGYEDAFLHVEHDDHDLNYFIHFHLDVIIKSIEDFKKHLAESQIKLRELARELEEFNLNWRQLALVRHAQRHPTSAYTIRTHQEIHGVSRITATKDLKELVSKRLLVEEKQSKTHLFFLKQQAGAPM